VAQRPALARSANMRHGMPCIVTSHQPLGACSVSGAGSTEWMALESRSVNMLSARTSVHR
jgi:hypothetical protein